MIYHGKTYQNSGCRPIGIYVDHHGEGHRQRAIAIARQAPGYFTLLGTGLKGKSEALPIVDLPDELYFHTNASTSASAAEPDFSAPNRLSRQHRLQRIAEWIDIADPALLLIDSCVEVASLAQLKGVPTVYMRLSGKHYDPAHLRAFAGADAVLCPFHPLLESEATPQWLRAHSRYFPGLTQKDNFLHTAANTKISAEKTAAAQKPELPAAPQRRTLLIVTGHECLGKRHMSAKAHQFLKAAQALPDWQLHIIGQACPRTIETACPDNLHFHGWVEHMEDFINKADLVAGAASDCLISAIAAAGKPFICMPQQRPFGEQYEKAGRLARLHAATICRNWPRNWQKTVQKAMKHGAVLAALHDDNAPALAAEFLLGLAYGNRQAAYNTAIGGGLAASLTAIVRESRAGRPLKHSAALWRKNGAKQQPPRKAA
ncbi:MAG: hypothetical protein DU429_03245 [Candidatus Tokpelaia sp.]|nr:MAG: hypothetical protein DU430_01105 [Candidatus Tokpelaia sp.]KAA6207134.1 MAG: hypothetical protein DU429_03245 [Candidatus Tokpelaia sp.]